jgi:hypothetical protein
MVNNLKTELVLDAVNMAIYISRPEPGLFTTRIGAASKPRWSSVAGSEKWGCLRRDLSQMPTITRWPRASSLP